MKTITIVSTKEQKKYVIESEATTMGELTADMDNNGIDYAGMTLYEGLSKAEYDPTKADAILPHDIPYKGTVTNDLVFMLTVPQKKIKSGISSRAEAYEYFKANETAATSFKAAYGKNFTNAKTEDLIAFICSSTTASSTETSPVKEETKTEYIDVNARKAIKMLIEALYDNDCIYTDDYDDICELIKIPMETVGAESPFSDSEIDNMFANI